MPAVALFLEFFIAATTRLRKRAASPIISIVARYRSGAFGKDYLNEAAYSIYLFIRDVCRGDLVAWLDRWLADYDPGFTAPYRARVIWNALLEPFGFIAGMGRKLSSMILSELLLAGDPDRERWATTGGSMIAADSLEHNLLHRTGMFDIFDAQHCYGASCYGPGSCADIIGQLSAKSTAR